MINLIERGGYCMKDNDLTTEDVAEQLKVSKLTVYDLIKKGKLPSYRVGRQIRVERDALHAYKNQSQNQSSVTTGITPAKSTSQLIISGQDNSLDVLAKQLTENMPSLQFLRSYMGSLDGLIAMYQDKADIVSTHLFDGETGTYNLPYTHKILGSKSYIVIHLMKRKAGLFVQKNNPKNIESWKDFERPDIILANREPGAGARVLLDEQLRLHHIERSKISGYDHTYPSHLDVASQIASGKADIGVGSEQAAKIANVDFIEMIEESYDLVILKTEQNNEIIDKVRTILQTERFLHTLTSLNYNTSETGKILHDQ